MNTFRLKIHSLNISEKKGTIKNPVEKIELNSLGVVNDSHSGKWHRQVSLLGIESFRKFSDQAGRKINFGEFAENITTEGFELFKMSPLDRLINENIELEITQIGKSCHGDKCAIYREVGNCVMPKEGIFARVIKGGELNTDDYLNYQPKIFKAIIITLSDRAHAGEYADKSGPALKQNLTDYFNSISWKIEILNQLIPDDSDNLSNLLTSASHNYDMIFTTGGTGIGPRDITVDTVKPMLDKEIPGIMELIRVKYGMQKPNAMLSRGVAGLIGNSFVFTLPGSVNAVNEYMNEINSILKHLILMQHSIDTH